MRGLMMESPLLISQIAQHAERNFSNREIVSINWETPLMRYTYADCFRRSRKLANALSKLGLLPGDRVATMAWNDHRHLEAYYGIGGAGFVCHTINPRLFLEQIAFIINHAEDKWILVDPSFVPMLEKIAARTPNVLGYVIMTNEQHMPTTSLPNVQSFEALISTESDKFDWPLLDENEAVGLCYTSGTTGDPKGVLYSHRSTILHACAISLPDVLGLANRDCVLPAVPLFHVNAWGVPYAAMMVGAKLVLPGAKVGESEDLYTLLESEQVTLTLGVPTIWRGLLEYMKYSGKRLTTLERMCIGGAAVPASMIREFAECHGVVVNQGWGMTETSPFGVIGSLKVDMLGRNIDEVLPIKVKTGRGIFGIDMRIVDDASNELPWDGESVGSLQVRGPWVCSSYFQLQATEGAHTTDGWFDTGDVGAIDPDGYLQITDRKKDVIKSGGEWISSIQLENVAVGHPSVAQAAVIGVPHEKWSERPLLMIVQAEGCEVSQAEILAWLQGRVAKWWLPDEVIFVDSLPYTATGKIRKAELREQLADLRQRTGAPDV